MTIQRIDIENFQSHKKTSLDLDPHVNVIVGESDGGKTAVLRALKWVCMNRPLGDAFRNWDGGDTRATITLTDGTKVDRKKTKDFNGYIIDDDKPYKALGTDIPQPVLDALNISDLSWQSQMDAPFLLSESAGEVARALNKVADLDRIDSTLANINRMIRDTKTLITSEEQDVVRLVNELRGYDSVDDLLKRVAGLQKLEKVVGLLKEMVSKGEEFLAKITNREEQLTECPDITRAERSLAELRELEIKSRDTEETANKGRGLLVMIADRSKQLIECLDTTHAGRMLSELDMLMDTSQELEDKHQKACGILSTYRQKDASLNDVIEDLNKEERQWLALFPDVCPLCNQPTKTR